MRSPLLLPSSPARSITARLVRFGAAGFAAALVAAPMAHGDDAPTPLSTDTGTPPADPGTPTDATTPTDAATPTDTGTPSDTTTPTDSTTNSEPTTPADPTTGSAPAPSPTGSAPRAKAGTAKSRAKVTRVAVTPAVVGDYGLRKINIGVQTDAGTYYYPPGTTTVGSTMEIVETSSLLPPAPPKTTLCTTVADSPDPADTGSHCEFFGGPFGYVADPGGTVVVRQIAPPQPGMIIDPLPQTVPACVNPVAVVADVAAPQAVPAAEGPPCPLFPFEGTSLTFTDPGIPPNAVDDVSSVASGGSVQVQVLSNDETAGAPTTISAVSTPPHGTAVLSGTHITYTPAAGFFGVEAFTYTITTPNGSSTATVSITVTAPPIAVDDAASTLGGTDAAGQPVSVAVLANDKAQGGALSITAVGAAAHGTATVNGASIVYTPSAGFSGTDTFTYTITNGHGSSTASVTITVTAPLVVDGLANTGAPSEQLLGAASLLILSGGGLALAGRRRRSNA
jgi:hypothetical protein